MNVKVATDSRKIGQLLVLEHGQYETLFDDTIALTQELEAMHGRVIECGRVDNHWIFKRLRDDRLHPNGKKTVLSNLLVRTCKLIK